jgi:ABC-type lipoprotein release transport system permease subunit
VAYYSLEQVSAYASSVEVRTCANFEELSSNLRQAIHEVDPKLPVVQITPLLTRVGDNLNREKLVARLSGAFALFALLLASIDIYGVLPYQIVRRTSEMGIRVALGARPSAIGALIVREAALVVTAGLAVGIPIVLGGASLVRSRLFGMSYADPVSFSAGFVFSQVCPSSSELASEIACSNSPMLWFKVRICATITRNST